MSGSRVVPQAPAIYLYTSHPHTFNIGLILDLSLPANGYVFLSVLPVKLEMRQMPNGLLIYRRSLLCNALILAFYWPAVFYCSGWHLRIVSNLKFSRDLKCKMCRVPEKGAWNDKRETQSHSRSRVLLMRDQSSTCFCVNLPLAPRTQ
jgi:hypothetical protein